MRTQDTGKALALSVFLHGLWLSYGLGAFDASKTPMEKKRIDMAQQTASLNVTYINLSPVTSPPDANLPKKPDLQNVVTSPKPKPEPEQTAASVKPKDTEKPSETVVLDPTLDSNYIPLKALKYFSTEEVLEPARPLSDWLLDNQALPAGRVYRIYVQIWILETGEFEKFELIEESLTDDLAIAATKNLSQTPMLPAIQDGKPVASTRKLIILIDKDE
jgi:hypothetical protein